MDMTGGRRTQAERDAMTVEIGYALVSAVFVAAVLFGVVAGPALMFELPGVVETLLVRGALVLVPVVFLVRVVTVLYRYRQAAGQPSQPGRTNPDS
ncbi:DUF6332 family protein [Streptomyces xylophagus]|uniref:DUF6332 family protein n=1 Tax=Streptomyces xylophagus TaxID=285514 RepID=UPI0005B9EBE8|nr:DUF6332 family protein [Streptomyces xylophagus]